MNDPFERTIGNILKMFGININPYTLHITLYNYIPGFILMPYVIYKGIQYNDKLIIIMGIFMMIVEMRFIISHLKNKINKKDVKD